MKKLKLILLFTLINTSFANESSSSPLRYDPNDIFLLNGSTSIELLIGWRQHENDSNAIQVAKMAFPLDLVRRRKAPHKKVLQQTIEEAREKHLKIEITPDGELFTINITDEHTEKYKAAVAKAQKEKSREDKLSKIVGLLEKIQKESLNPVEIHAIKCQLMGKDPATTKPEEIYKLD
ncbi:hypothetical protein N9O57_00380 [bacterium]|nr:hypothetical protein [bacterium]